MSDLPADRYIEEALRQGGLRDTIPAHVQSSPSVYPATIALARMIEKYEPIPEPVDPDLLIAREAVETAVHWSPQTDRDLQSGKNDNSDEMKCALRAIKLAREKGVL